MGMEKSHVDQEILNQKPNSIEQQESDPMIGLEKAATEFGTNTEKLDGLLKSEGGVDSLSAEDSKNFSAFKESLLSKFEDLKKYLPFAGAALGTLALGAGLDVSGVSVDLMTAGEFIDVGAGLATIASVIAMVGHFAHVTSH